MNSLESFLSHSVQIKTFGLLVRGILVIFVCAKILLDLPTQTAKHNIAILDVSFLKCMVVMIFKVCLSSTLIFYILWLGGDA